MDLELDQFRDVDLVIDRANDSFVQKQFVSQGDYKGRTLTVQVTNNGNVGEVPGLALNLRWHNLASGLTDLTAFSVLDKENSVFRIEYPEHMLTPGKVVASIQVLQGGKSTFTKEFAIMVQNLLGELTGVIEKAEFSALVAALAETNIWSTKIQMLDLKKADKTELNDSMAEVQSQLNTKASIDSVDNLSDVVAKKRDKDVLINSGDISDELRSAIAGTGVIAQNVADKTITPEKTTFINSENLLDMRKATDNSYVAWDDGTLRPSPNYQAVMHVRLIPGETYTFFQTTQIAFEDANFVFKQGLNGGGTTTPRTFTMPSDCLYASFSVNKTLANADKPMLNVGNKLKLYKEFENLLDGRLLNNFDGKYLKDNSVDAVKTSFIVAKNLADVSDTIDGMYARYDTGVLNANADYEVINNPIELVEGQYYTMSQNVQIAFLDSEKIYHSGLSGTGALTPRTFQCPVGAKYMLANVLKAGKSTYQIEEGQAATEYQNPSKRKLKKEYLPDTIESTSDQFLLNIPPIIYVVPGITIELYHKQIAWAGNMDNFHFKWTGAVGKAFKRKWSITATNAMVGSYPITCTVFDNNMKEVASKEFTCVIGTYSFSGVKNILTLADSLGNTTSTDKPWYKKVTQLTSKIKFVGTRGLEAGLMHEGRSGWTAGHYLRAAEYTFEGEGVHPFWNPSTQSFDFNYYKSQTGINPDAVQILLGTNGMAIDPTINANNIKTIVDKIREADPNIPIFIMHTIYRSNQDGIANQTSNDGYTASSGVWKLEEDRKVFNLIQRLQDLMMGYQKLVFVPLAHAMDSEYNYGNVATNVNPRNSNVKVDMPPESIHPAYEGYMQFADVDFCSFLAFNNF